MDGEKGSIHEKGSFHKKGDIIEQWEQVEVPPPPKVQAVTVDPATTALLILDIQKTNCSAQRRPRCVATLPGVRALLARARAAGMPVVYSLIRGTDLSDVRDEVAPLPGEPAVKSSVDKFYGTELEAILEQSGVETVILVGTSAHGAVLHTATGAAQRGLRVVVPVDGLSSGDAYAEQYTCWHLVNAPGTRRWAVLTRVEEIGF